MLSLLSVLVLRLFAYVETVHVFRLVTIVYERLLSLVAYLSCLEVQLVNIPLGASSFSFLASIALT